MIERLRHDLAWQLAMRQPTMMRLTLKAHHRDVVGALLASVVSMTKLIFTAVTGKRLAGQTEIERRAVVNARRRLVAKLEAERQAGEEK